MGASVLTLKVSPRGPLLAQERGCHVWVFRRYGGKVRCVFVCVCVVTMCLCVLCLKICVWMGGDGVCSGGKGMNSAGVR